MTKGYLHLTIGLHESRFVHTERKTKTAYFISRVDEAMYLVLLMEGGRRLNDKVAQVRLGFVFKKCIVGREFTCSVHLNRTSCKV